MKKTIRSLALISVVLSSINSLADNVKPAPNGIKFPENYKDWKIVSTAHRIDNNTLRIIVGNDIAVEASRSGKTNPWPKGSILGKLVWHQKNDEHWEAAIVPDDKFIHAEFMFKDSEEFSATGGWGYARWLGLKLEPYGENKNFSQGCLACHAPLKDRDYVFTTPVILP